jgi:transposase
MLTANAASPRKKCGTSIARYLRDIFIRLANGHLDKDIDALMPWAYAQRPDGS